MAGFFLTGLFNCFSDLIKFYFEKNESSSKNLKTKTCHFIRIIQLLTFAVCIHHNVNNINLLIAKILENAISNFQFLYTIYFFCFKITKNRFCVFLTSQASLPGNPMELKIICGDSTSAEQPYNTTILFPISFSLYF